VLGALFRSVRYERRETELVVLVTPRLVEAMNPNQVPPLPGESWRHPDELDLYFNQDIGGESAAKPTDPEMTPPGAHSDDGGTAATPTRTDGSKPPAVKRYHGAYGFTPPSAPAPAPRGTTGGAD
jgi:pilus assembly protein CpaC